MTQLLNTSLKGNVNLLAHYQFNTGALVTDSSGNTRTLTNTGTVGEIASGKYGYSADFGTSNSTKYFVRAEDIWANGAISCAFWAKRSNTSDTHSMIFFNDAETMKQLYLYTTSNSIVGQIYRVGVNYDTVSATITPDTAWHHYAMTLTTGAGGTLKVYYDGVEVGYGSATNSSGNIGQTDQYMIGRGPSTDYMEGYIDDVAIFNDVLTAAEVKELSSDGGIFL